MNPLRNFTRLQYYIQTSNESPYDGINTSGVASVAHSLQNNAIVHASPSKQIAKSRWFFRIKLQFHSHLSVFYCA